MAANSVHQNLHVDIETVIHGRDSLQRALIITLWTFTLGIVAGYTWFAYVCVCFMWNLP